MNAQIKTDPTDPLAAAQNELQAALVEKAQYAQRAADTARELALSDVGLQSAENERNSATARYNAEKRKYAEKIHTRPTDKASDSAELARLDELRRKVSDCRHTVRIWIENRKHCQLVHDERVKELRAAEKLAEAAARRVIDREMSAAVSKFNEAFDAVLASGANIVTFAGNDICHKSTDRYHTPEIEAAISRWMRQFDDMNMPANFWAAQKPPRWRARLAELLASGGEIKAISALT
jgi:hypothetical protein